MKQYIVTDKQQTGLNATALRLRPVEGVSGLAYSAGQYVAVGFRRGWQHTPMRCFSATTAPSESGELGVAFRNLGSFTKAFAELVPGSVVDVAGPFGDFTVSRDETRPLVLLAGGIGITPFLSILRDLENRRTALPVTLLYSISSLQDVPFARELMDLAQRNANYTIRFLTTNVPAEKVGHPMIIQSRLSTELIEQFATVDTQYYICGPQGYAAAANDILERLQVQDYVIHNEAFSQSSKLTVAGFAVQKLVYGLLAAAVIAGSGLFVARDLVKAQEKDDAATQTYTTAPTTTTDTDTSTVTPSATDTTTPSTSTNSSSTTQTYYAPRSTMS